MKKNLKLHIISSAVALFWLQMGLILLFTLFVIVYFILSRLLYLAYSANLGLLCMPHPGMGPMQISLSIVSLRLNCTNVFRTAYFAWNCTLKRRWYTCLDYLCAQKTLNGLIFKD